MRDLRSACANARPLIAIAQFHMPFYMLKFIALAIAAPQLRLARNAMAKPQNPTLKLGSLGIAITAITPGFRRMEGNTGF